MNTIAEKFKNDRYAYASGLLTESECSDAISILVDSHKNNYSVSDDQCPNSICFSSGELTDFHFGKKEMFEDLLGIKLIPTYNYSRIYKHGEVLKKHIDRYACEISVTVTLGYVGDIWPIYFLDRNDSAENVFYYHDFTTSEKYRVGTAQGDDCFSPLMDTSNKIKFEIQKGDGVFYRGCELIHWREEYVEGQEQAQVFFHYVNANGPYRDLNRYKHGYEFN